MNVYNIAESLSAASLSRSITDTRLHLESCFHVPSKFATADPSRPRGSESLSTLPSILSILESGTSDFLGDQKLSDHFARLSVVMIESEMGDIFRNQQPLNQAEKSVASFVF